MSSVAQIKKFELIINFIKKKKYCSATEIIDFLFDQESKLQYRNEDFQFATSIRTLQRDFKKIWDVFNIQIAYSRKDKGYFIVNKDDVDFSNIVRIFEAHEIVSLLNASTTITEFVQLEQRSPLGMQYLEPLIRAMRKRKVVKINYQSFTDESEQSRYVLPYLIKEYNDRWYLIAYDERTENIKTFGLDRINAMELIGRSFDNINIEAAKEMYKYAFGITANPNIKPEKISIQLTTLQARYIKTLPLHHTQKIVSESPQDNSCIISIYTQPTYELIQAILKLGPGAKVLAPESLVNKVVSTLSASLQQYKD